MKFLCGLIISLNGMGQTYHEQTGNAYITAGAYSTHFINAFSFESNPASLGSTEGFFCGILAERKWMLNELNNYALAVSGNLGRGGLGILFQQSGDIDFNEQSFELAYGKNLGKVEMGIRFNYLQDKASGYQRCWFWSRRIGYEISGIRKINNRMDTGPSCFWRSR